MGFLLNPVTALMARLSLANKILLPSLIILLCWVPLLVLDASQATLSMASLDPGLLLVWFGVPSLLFLMSMLGLYQYLKGMLGTLHGTTASLLAGQVEERFVTDDGDTAYEVFTRLNTLSRNHRRMLERLERLYEEIDFTSKRLTENSQRIVSGANQQSDMARAVASAIEEMTATIRVVAAEAGQSADTARHTGELSAQGEAGVTEVAQRIQSLAENIRTTSALVDQLHEKSNSINAAVDTISGIAEKTNLLALNAAIESARAGEHGRGFAVVADEVRNLARHAAEAAMGIRVIVEGVQRDIQHSHTGMAAARAEAQASVAIAERSVRLLADIRSEAHNSMDRVQDIAAATQQQSVAIGEIAANTEQIFTFAEVNTRVTNETLEIATHLKGLGAGLGDTINATH